MKKNVVLAVSLSLSIFVAAQDFEEFKFEADFKQLDSEQLIEAPSDVLKTVTRDCQDWSTDDAIIASELTSYLLSCVNEELKYQGYKPISSLPK